MILLRIGSVLLIQIVLEKKDDFWYQDTSSCTDIGDINFDYSINIQDIIQLIRFIIEIETPDYQQAFASDFNSDGFFDVLDVIQIVELIIN